MSFPYIQAVNIIPSGNEYSLDTIAYSGRAPNTVSFVPINTYHSPGGTKTDFCYALDQLQTELPNCQFVSLVIQWYGDSLDASVCKVYPSTTYWLGASVGAFQPTFGGTTDSGITGYWAVSSLRMSDCNSGLIPISRPDGVNSSYGGTPSDPSVVRAIREIKSRGLKVALYVQLNLDVTSKPWRGMITYANDVSVGADNAVAHFLGSAATTDFTQDPTNLTVAYSGSKYDFTFRRFILHYANLACVAGGVNLFCINGELVGLEQIRGSTWTPAGTIDGGGKNHWDYPFVTGLIALVNDIRTTFDAAGLTKNLAARQNLITYSPDWSQWTGEQRGGTFGGHVYAGIWPHMDDLYSTANLDLVSVDNYVPLSDWTTGDGGYDARNWTGTPPTSWPVASPTTIGLGLTGVPDIHRIDYLKTQIEGGEKYNYWYANYTSSLVLDSNGTYQWITLPQGDRVTQARNPYGTGEEIFALKQFRWWWNNTHKAFYSVDGAGWGPRGNVTTWVPNSKSIMHMEYGSPFSDKATNQPNLFFDLSSVAGGTQFWTVWKPDKSAPLVDNTIGLNYHQAFNEYWQENNDTVSGVPMIATDMLFAWNWDPRPFPTFPFRSDIWGDAVNWENSHWLNGKLPQFPAPSAPTPPAAPTLNVFPTLPGLGWSATLRPKFATQVHEHASGRSSRRSKMLYPNYEIELTYDLLRSGTQQELQSLAGFFKQQGGQTTPFWFSFPSLSTITASNIGTGDGTTKTFTITFPFGPLATPAPGAMGINTVYLNGVAQAASAYTLGLASPPAITFASAPALGVAITVDATIIYICRFVDDMLDFEQFSLNRFEAKSIKLETVKDWNSIATLVDAVTIAQIGGGLPQDWYLASLPYNIAADWGVASLPATASADWGTIV